MIPAETQGDEFTTARILWYSDTDVKMFIDTRFDGNGNAIVRFVIRNEGKEMQYEKYDSAVGAYNMIVGKVNAKKKFVLS